MFLIAVGGPLHDNTLTFFHKKQYSPQCLTYQAITFLHSRHFNYSAIRVAGHISKIWEGGACEIECVW